MEKYYADLKLRAKIQMITTAVLLVLMSLAIAFMYLFVSTPSGKPNARDFSVTAIVFTVIFCICYLVQGIFAIATYVSTADRKPLDKVFVAVNVLILPLACGIYGILIACM